MKRPMPLRSVCVACWLCVAAGAAPAPAPGQSRGGIAGRLVDRTSRLPLEGASVTVMGTPRILRSNADGRFNVELAPGVYVLQARALGYAAGSWVVQLADRETLSVVIELEATPVTLAGVTVAGERPTQRGLEGFELRRARGRGIYLSEHDIQQAKATTLSDVLRTLPGVRLVCRFRTCRVTMSRGECQPDYFVDGYPANNSTTLEMPLVGVIAVEVYRTITETPVEFLRGDNTCGTVVLWTRSGP
jgi:hypothetical protein